MLTAMPSASLAQALPFVHPGIAGAAVLAALLPLIIHLISRRRYRRMPWAAMSFLLAATRRTARRLRLEQLLLLVVRTAIVLLFGLALARPFLSAPTVARATGASGHRILLLDNSLSMSAARSDRDTRFDAARRYAVDLLDQFASGDAVSIISLAAPSERLLTYPSHDRRLARERLLSLPATHRPTDFPGGVAEAAKLLNDWQGPPGSQTVYIISDFSLPRADIDAEADSPSAAAEALAELLRREFRDKTREVVLISADREHRPNAGVASLGLDQPVVVRGTAEPLTVAVVNYGPGRQAASTLQILDRGEVIRREEVPPLPAGRAHRTRVTIAFATPGIHLLEARLIRGQGDALPADDTRYLSIEVVHSIRALLVDGHRAAKPPDGEAGYLALALSPASRMDAADETARIVEDVIESKIVAPQDFSAAALDDFDVIALCNVEQLAPEDWVRLRQYVIDGGGLMLFLGDRVNLDSYNALGFADGAGLLPAVLQPATDAKAAADEQPLRFSSEDLRHPLTNQFVSNPTSGLFSARIERYFPVEPASDAEVFLKYSDGAPALLARSLGRGRVFLYTTTANMAWNTLPAKGDYVSLMRGAASYAARSRGAARNLLVGQDVRERLTAAEVQLPYRAQGPTQAALALIISQERDGLTLVLPSPSWAGAYELSIGDSLRPFAVNTEAAECDLTVASVQAICTQVGNTCRATSIVAQPEPHEASPAVELGAISLLAVCGLLLAELWLASRFGFSRGGHTP